VPCPTWHAVTWYPRHPPFDRPPVHQRGMAIAGDRPFPERRTGDKGDKELMNRLRALGYLE